MSIRIVQRGNAVIGRLVRSADFERVLRTRTRVSSVHFAVHHVADVPSRPMRAALTRSPSPAAHLSTVGVGDEQRSVDEPDLRPLSRSTASAFGEVWLGAVIPKRHAKRSVTRTLLKRQIRAVMASRHTLLASGLWVVRLRAPFDRRQFSSAASEAMKRLARGELEQLLATAAAQAGGQPARR